MIWAPSTGCSGSLTLSRLLRGKHEPLATPAFRQWRQEGGSVDGVIIRLQQALYEGIPAVGFHYAYVMPVIKEIDPDFKFIVVLRDPYLTIPCMLSKGFLTPHATSYMADLFKEPSSIVELNYWLYLTNLILDGLEGDWEFGWTAELPKKSISHQSKDADEYLYTRRQAAEIESFSHETMTRLRQAHADSVSRGRPTLEAL